MGKVISIQNEEDVGKPKPTRIEIALAQVAGRTLLRERYDSMERLFSPEGLRDVGFGEKTIRRFITSGQLAYVKTYVKATLGGGLLGEKAPLGPSQVLAFFKIMGMYQELIETMTVRNEMEQEITVKGVLYKPGEIILSGEDNPTTSDYADTGLTMLGYHFCRSIYKEQTEQSVIFPTDILMPQGPGFGKWRDNMGKPQQGQKLTE